MPLTAELTPANHRDAITIALLSRNLIEYGLPWRWTPGRVQRCIEHPDYTVLAARCDGEIAGFAIMQYLDRQAHLCLLAVAPRFRRRGLGQRLLGWLEQSAVVAGIFRIKVEVRSSNVAAVRFYHCRGYREDRVLPAYYSSQESALRMSHDLRKGLMQSPPPV